MTTTTSSLHPMRITLHSFLASVALAFAGCDDIDEAGAELTVIEQAAEILAEIEMEDGVKLTFTREVAPDGGDPIVAITELAPVGAPSHLERLRATNATSLESFLALAPAGTEPPAALRAAHERESGELDRPTELRAFAALGVPIEPPLKHPMCNNFTAFKAAVDDLKSVKVSESVKAHSLSSAADVGGNVDALMCNYNSDRVDYKYAQFCTEIVLDGADFGYLYCDTKVMVPDGHRVYRIWFGSTSKHVVRAEALANYTLAVSSFLAIGGAAPIP